MAENPDELEIRFLGDETALNKEIFGIPFSEAVSHMKLSPCSKCGKELVEGETNAVENVYVEDGVIHGDHLCADCLKLEIEQYEQDLETANKALSEMLWARAPICCAMIRSDEDAEFHLGLWAVRDPAIIKLIVLIQNLVDEGMPYDPEAEEIVRSFFEWAKTKKGG